MPSGSFTVSTTNPYIVGTCSWSQASQNVANNTSVVHVELRLSRTNSGYTSSGTGEFYVGVDDEFSYNSLSFSITQNSNTLVVSNDFTVSHYDDGSFWIYIKCGGNANTPFTVQGFCSAENEVVLDTIPRVSQPSTNVSSCDLGSAFTINTNRKSGSFTHNISLAYGGYTATIATGVTDSFSYTPPKSLASQFPNATSGTCRLDVTTFNGSSNIGTRSTTITLNIPSDIIPTISGYTTYEGDGTLGKYSIDFFVQGKSWISVVVNASGVYGSNIIDCDVTYDGKLMPKANNIMGTSGVQPTSSGTKTITMVVTDSRGRKSTITSATITVSPYVIPTVSTFTASRCTVEGNPDDEGAYALVTIAAVVTALSTINTATYKLEYKLKTDTVYTTSFYYNSNQPLTLNTTKIIPVNTELVYDFRFTVHDIFGDIIYNIPLSTAFTLIDIYKDGTGLAIGKVAQLANKLEIALSTQFQNAIAFNSDVWMGPDTDRFKLLDKIYGITGYTVNTNGRAWKFPDGTLICAKYVDFNSIACTTAWGNWFVTGALNLGSYALAFISQPDVEMVVGGGADNQTDGFAAGIVQKSLNAWTSGAPSQIGSVYFARPVSGTFNIRIKVKAIGRWK